MATSTAQQLDEWDKKHFIHGHQTAEKDDAIIWTGGEGVVLFDSHNKMYIDAVGSLFCVNVGHGRAEIAQVAAKQMQTLAFVPSLMGYSNPPAVQLSAKLVSLARKEGLSAIGSAYFASGGSEANESAIHMAFKYWAAKGMPQKKAILCFKNCYHGSTFACASLTEKISDFGFSYTADDKDLVIRVEFPHELFFTGKKSPDDNVGQAAARALEEAIVQFGADKIGVMIGEPIQGGPGAVVPHADFWPLAKQVLEKHNILFIADEVMTYAKTGRFFAMSHWNVCPDMITLAKGITSGYLPMSAVLVTDKVRNGMFQDKSDLKHDFTFSANPVCCAVALKAIDIIEQEGLLDKANIIGQRLMQGLQSRLRKHSFVKDIRGMGVLVAVQLENKNPKELEKRLVRNFGILAHGNSKGLSFAPALTISDTQIDTIVHCVAHLLSQSSQE